MELRVAEAIFRAEPCTTGAWSWGGLLARKPNTEYCQYRVKECLATARAAIRAMREPTEAMKNAGYRLDGGTPYDVPAGCEAHWQAMIDAASTPEGES